MPILRPISPFNTKVPGKNKTTSRVNSGGGGGGGGAAPADGLYFMSNEVPTASTVLTDDFRRGSWYLVDADNTNWQTDAPGWAGTIFNNPITPAGAVRNLQAIDKKPLFATSDYVATSGIRDGSAGGSNMASHNLSGANNGGYDEIYCRFYQFYVPANYYGAGNPSANYLWGNQKSGTVNRWNDDAGIYWASALQYNIGTGTAGSTGDPLMHPGVNGEDNNIGQNQGNDILLVAGNWYFIEWHIKLNSVGNSDGVYDLWVTDLGSTGDQSGKSPVLRTHRTNINYGRSGADNELIGNIWFENWANPGSSGEMFWANIHAATSGPIGFV